MQTAIEKSVIVAARIAQGDTVQAVENSEPVSLDLSRLDRLVKAWGYEINALGSVIVKRGKMWLAVNVSAKGVVHVEAHYGWRFESILRVIPLMLAELDAPESAPAVPAWIGPAPAAPTAN